MALVADYGTSSESENDSDSSENLESKNQPNISTNSIEKLPKPNFDGNTTSVFSNPFIEAENAKTAILEKHVKMVPTTNDTTTINGKKICWNYRKGRCRFGHKCAFAHDSDLQKTEEEMSKNEEFTKKSTILSQDQIGGSKTPGTLEDPKKSKKRPGLSQTLVPGKKVMKIFNKQNSNKPLC